MLGAKIETGAAVVILDSSGDGIHDICVTGTQWANALCANDGTGTFTEVAAAAGVDDPLGRSDGGCAADYDNDGA